MGVHQDLRVVRCRCLWVDVVVEARRTGSKKAGIASHLVPLVENSLYVPDGCIRGFNTRSFWKPDIHDELIALCKGKELLSHKVQDHYSRYKGQYSGDQDSATIAHGPGNDPVVI